MGMLARAFARKSASSYDILRQLANWAGRTSASGKTVSVKTALEVSTVLACARVRANGLAQVPCKIMRESQDGRTRLPAKDHSLYAKLNSRPNDWQTAFEYWETVSFHLDLCGNHFSFINRSNRAGIMELIPFEPGSVTVKRDPDTYELTYAVRGKNGVVQVFPAKVIWHVKGPSWDSWQGLEAVCLAREAIGLSMAIEESQARMHKHGVQTSGAYSVEGTLSPQQYADLRKWIDANYGGAENAGKAMILDRNAKWLNTSMTGIDAQTQETRRFQVEEICRQLGVNPIMVFAESKNTTYASAEQMFLAHVVHTLAPTYRRIEQSIDANLLTDADRADGLYANFVDAGLLRGSIETQKDVLLGYLNGGAMYANEVRAKLDLPPDDDPESDKLRIPANIVGAVPPAVPPGGGTSKPEPAVAKALTDLQADVKALSMREPAPINVDARTTIQPAAAPQVTVNVPEQKAPDVKVEITAPVVNVAPPAVTVNVPERQSEASAGDTNVNVQLPEQMTHSLELAGVGELADETRRLATLVSQQSHAAQEKFLALESSQQALKEAVLAPRKGVIERDENGNPTGVRTTIEV